MKASAGDPSHRRRLEAPVFQRMFSLLAILSLLLPQFLAVPSAQAAGGAYNIKWYASLGAEFFNQAAQFGADRDRSRMIEAMAARFGFWRRQQRRLAIELRDLPRLLFRTPQSG